LNAEIFRTLSQCQAVEIIRSIEEGAFIFSVCNPGCRNTGSFFLSATSVVSAVFNDSLNVSRSGPVRAPIAGHAREPPGSRACCGGLACTADSQCQTARQNHV
jgi:hypothetical protein